MKAHTHTHTFIMPRSPRPEVLTTLDLLGLFDKDSGLPTHSCHPVYRRHARDNIRETLAARTAARLCHKEATLSPAPRYTLAPAAPVAPLKSCLKQPSRGTKKSVSINTARFSRTIIPCSTSSGAERVDNTFAGVPNHRPAISIRSSLAAESDKAAEFWNHDAPISIWLSMHALVDDQPEQLLSLSSTSVAITFFGHESTTIFFPAEVTETFLSFGMTQRHRPRRPLSKATTR